MKTTRLYIAAVLFSALILSACNTKTVDVTVPLKNAELVLEAPAFAGSNTLQTELALDVDQNFADAGADKNNITEAALTTATIKHKDGSTFDNYESVLLLLFNEKTSMTEVAQLTTIPEGATELVLNVSNEKSATEFFKQPKIGIVIDANLKADDTTGRTINCDLTFVVKAKSK